MTTVTVSEARAALPAILDRVQAGEEITITRHGRAVAVVVRPDTLRARRCAALAGLVQRVQASIEDARTGPLSAAGLSNDRAEELVAEVRAGRSRVSWTHSTPTS